MKQYAESPVPASPYDIISLLSDHGIQRRKPETTLAIPSAHPSHSPTPSMSASAGNPGLQVAADANDGNKRGRRDVEQGDLHTEKQRFSPNLEGSSSSNDGKPEDEGDEYIRLLKFIELEAKKEKLRRDEDHGGDEDEETQRLWYMPWKKVPVQGTSTKARKVPQGWLETDISQGLSLSEIDVRRARFGYNELER